MPIGYNAGGIVTPNTYNWVTGMDLDKPAIDSKLTEPFGDQTLDGMMSMIGAEKGVSALEYKHAEEKRIYPKLKATNGGAGGAGEAVTFTLVADAQQTINNSSPYLVSTPANPVAGKNVVVPRKGETLMIKPVTGLATVDNSIYATVTDVNAATGTFVAIPLDAGDIIPSMAAAQEIIIIGNANGEGSIAVAGRQVEVEYKTNQLQTFRGGTEVTGDARNIVTWQEFTGKNGEKGHVNYLHGEAAEYKNFKSQMELTFLLGKPLTNSTLANSDYFGTEHPVSMTKGLIPSILDEGNVSNYSATTGWDKQKAQALVETLDKQKGDKKNMICPGISLSMQIDDTLADYRTSGSITYGNYTFDENAKANFQFDAFNFGGYEFGKKVFNTFNDLQSLGAEGYGFPNEAMVIPMGMTMDKMDNAKTQYLRTRFLEDPRSGARDRRSSIIDKFQVNGQDTFQVNYIDKKGLETFALNKFAYIKQA
tara:strand:- start:2746 stop:4182 length:1437 start_codon:yes stop_codon:yes gene_type:complete